MARPARAGAARVSEGFPADGWSMAQWRARGCCRRRGGGDIMTDEEFGAFELQMEFKVSEGANSGIFYLPDFAARSGQQCAARSGIPDPRRRAASRREARHQWQSHAGLALRRAAAREADDQRGHRAQGRSVAARAHRGARRRHGGALAEWREGAGVQARLGRLPRACRGQQVQGDAGFGEAAEGRILLQDHGDAVAYRSIKIRPL